MGEVVKEIDCHLGGGGEESVFVSELQRYLKSLPKAGRSQISRGCSEHPHQWMLRKDKPMEHYF